MLDFIYLRGATLIRPANCQKFWQTIIDAVAAKTINQEGDCVNFIFDAKTIPEEANHFTAVFHDFFLKIEIHYNFNGELTIRYKTNPPSGTAASVVDMCCKLEDSLSNVLGNNGFKWLQNDKCDFAYVININNNN